MYQGYIFRCLKHLEFKNMNGQAQRQIDENLVYWSAKKAVLQPVYHSMNKPLISETEQAKRCKQDMQALAAKQDKKAYKNLYLYFAPKVNTFFKQHASTCDADEMTHEVFIRVWQKAKTYRAERANVSTWIFAIARNLKIDVLRQKRITEVSLDDSHSQLQISEDNVHKELVSTSEKIQVTNNLKHLNEEQKQVILKVYFEDKSHQLAAQELGLTLGVIKSRIRSSLKVLRHHLGSQNE